MRRFLDAVTRFVFASDEPAPADLIFVPGSSRPEHVLRAAELYRLGYAPLLLPSGLRPIGSEGFSVPGYASEWAWMRAQLLEAGVPDSAILREDRATYTWQNAQFSRAVADAHGLRVRKALLCCKPYHARRALLYYQAAFPGTALLACPASMPGLNADDWHLTPEGREKVLGEVRRLGSQVNEVLEAAIGGAAP